MANNRNEKIQTWLAGPKLWEEGSSLYLKYGSNEGLKAIFRASGETAYNFNKLVTELEGMVQATLATGKQCSLLKKKTVAGTPVAGTPVAYSPEVKNLFAERSMLHAQLLHLSSDGERREHAFQILDLSEQVEHHLTREAMNELEKLPDDRAQLVKLLNTNRAYISKNKNRLEKANQVNIRIEQNLKIDELLRVED